MSAADDGFLARWSRRKARVQDGGAEPVRAENPAPVPTPDPAANLAGNPAHKAAVHGARPAQPGALAAAAEDATDARRVPAADPAPLPTMEDVALLTRASDYSRFVAPGVDRDISNAAMKKLFSDPHFNVMDGLDTYIDDYGKPDPIPIAMLRQMNQSKFLGLFDAEENDAAAPAPSTDGVPAPAVAQSFPPLAPEPLAPEARPDDDPDLRLQQDDAAERPGAAPGPGA